jgi:hypothetical protein
MRSGCCCLPARGARAAACAAAYTRSRARHIHRRMPSHFVVGVTLLPPLTQNALSPRAPTCMRLFWRRCAARHARYIGAGSRLRGAVGASNVPIIQTSVAWSAIPLRTRCAGLPPCLAAAPLTSRPSVRHARGVDARSAAVASLASDVFASHRAFSAARALHCF